MSKRMIRYLALCAIFGGILNILYQIGADVWGREIIQYGISKENGWIEFFTGPIEMIGDTLILLSLVSLFIYSYQKKPSKNTVISFVFLFFGIILSLCIDWYSTFVTTTLALNSADADLTLYFPLGVVYFGSFILVNLSLLYFGISNLVTRTFPRLSSLILIVLPFLGFFISFSWYFLSFLWGLAIILMGMTVYRDNRFKTDTNE